MSAGASAATAIVPASPLRRAVVAGAVTLDVNRVGRRRLLRPGGVPCHAGLTYRRLGLSVIAVTSLAPPDRGLLGPLSASGIDCRLIPGSRTTVFVNEHRGDARRQLAPALAAPIAAEAILGAATGADLLHLGPLHPADIDPALYRAGNPLPPVIALDLQGLVRRVEGDRVLPGASADLADALALATIVKSDRAEADCACRALGLGVEGLLERYRIAEWIVSAGAAGGTVWTADGGVHPWKAAAVRKPLDPTGAGDVFFAAYLTFRLRDGAPSGLAASRAAGIAARHVAGAFFALPDAEGLFSSPLPDAAARRALLDRDHGAGGVQDDELGR